MASPAASGRCGGKGSERVSSSNSKGRVVFPWEWDGRICGFAAAGMLVGWSAAVYVRRCDASPLRCCSSAAAESAMEVEIQPDSLPTRNFLNNFKIFKIFKIFSINAPSVLNYKSF